MCDGEKGLRRMFRDVHMETDSGCKADKEDTGPHCSRSPSRDDGRYFVSGRVFRAAICTVRTGALITSIFFIRRVIEKEEIVRFSVGFVPYVEQGSLQHELQSDACTVCSM